MKSLTLHDFRGVEEVLPESEFFDMLLQKRKLRIKLGVDPSRPDIHLGHTIPLRVMRQLQDMGHTIIFLIGDATARIGDPSGKNKTRPELDDAEIKRNAKTYLDQVGKILNVEKAEIRFNSEWHDKLKFVDLLKLAANFTVAQLIERDDFKNRLDSGNELALHELLYPVMQAYDSIALEADIELGGSDQRFNVLAGRALQKKLGQKPQAIVITKLLVGLDGANKMSKSLDNYVGISDGPTDMYGKIMSLPDNLIAPYYEFCTEVSLDIIDELVKSLSAGANPRDSKASLAREIVRIYHGDSKALAAEEAWNNQFRDGQRPTDIEVKTIKSADTPMVDVLVEVGLTTSKSESRRLIEQGGVHLNDAVVEYDANPVFASGDVIQVGKRRYVKLKI